MPQLLLITDGPVAAQEQQALECLAKLSRDPLHVDAADLDALLADQQLEEPLLAVLLPSVADALPIARRIRRTWQQAQLLIYRAPAGLAQFQQSLGAAPMLGRHWTVAPFDLRRLEPVAQQGLAAARQRHLFRARVASANAQLRTAQEVGSGEYQRLVASEHHLANFLRYSQDAVVGFDSRLQVIFWSRGAEEVLGESAARVLGRGVHELGAWADALRPVLQAVLAGSGPQMLEIETSAGAGQIVLEAAISAVPGGSEGAVAGVSAVLRDVTQRRRAQEQLRQAKEQLEETVRQRTRELEQSQQALIQSQKLEAIGKLTGGVAHDFNNLLQVIGSNLQLLGSRVQAQPEAESFLKAALAAVERGAKLSSQLLSFARKQPLNPVPLNLNRRVQQMDELLRRSLGEQVELETVLSAGLWTTYADPAQLENVLLNLAINARDAMPAGGKLTLETANVVLDEAYTRELRDVQPGQYVMVAVTDTGTGMPPEVAAHAFEPFFTTKPEGKGTGLGLSMAYGFAKQSGGHIRLYTELGTGTTVKLYLPRSHEAEPRRAAGPTAEVLGGSESILVVEDDPAVQAAVVNMLRELGYRVLRADDAQAGLAILESGVHVDLLFTDVVMPGPVRSTDLARAAKRLLPRIAVLFTSGYTQNAIVHGGRLDPGVDLLSKPYSQDQLARKVRQLLEGEKTAAEPAAPAARPGGKRTLLVEDEAGLRETTTELLQLLGLQVTAAGSAEEAQALLGNEFDLLITDISLPGRSGVELAQEVKNRLPHIVVVLSSGYGAPPAAPADFDYLLLPKPYTLDQLQQLLDKAGVGAARG